MIIFAPCLTVFIYQAAQNHKQIRGTLNFIKNDKLVTMQAKERRWVAEFYQILGRLKIQIDGWSVLSQNLRQGGFTNLPRPQKGYSRCATHCLLKSAGDPSISVSTN